MLLSAFNEHIVVLVYTLHGRLSKKLVAKCTL